jgi:hypothetical protein
MQANMDKGKQLPGSHLLAGVCFLLPVQLHVAVVMGPCAQQYHQQYAHLSNMCTAGAIITENTSGRHML